MARTRSFTVTAPASTGNLGPGFDVLGAALDLRNEVRVDAAGSGALTISGEGSGTLPTDSSNLVARSFEQAAGQGLADAGVDLHCTNRVPTARGLGSSTAAAACGLVAGWEFAGEEWDEDALFEALAALDGHPDNAAACAHGGIVLCHDRPAVGELPAELDVVPLGAAEWLMPVVVIPDRELATDEARRALPDSYPAATVVQAVGASALLLTGIAGGHLELIADALECDVLHEPFRASLVPELAEVREALGSTSALGATLSGAGPTVVAWCTPGSAAQAVGSLQIDFPDARVEALAITADGVLVRG